MKPGALPVAALSLAGLLAGNAGAAPPLTRACSAPALPRPPGPVVHVATEGQLQAALATLTSGTTILIRPGTYVLTATLRLDRNVRDVALRGGTDSCDDVVLVGPGMTNPSYGAVPHGIWIGSARQVLIANLTIRDVYYHPIQLDPGRGAQGPHIYNVRLVDAGQQFIKSSSNSGGGPGVNDGIVEYSVMEYTSTARSDYTNGVDVLQGANWIIRHNLFRNIRAPAGRLAGPAILVWRQSRNTVVDGNLLLNCQYGIALGLDPAQPGDHVGGIVRNNVVHRNSTQSGDVGITINNSAGTRVLHNTVILSGTYPNAIEYRFPATTAVEIRYNLSDGAVRSRDGASGIVTANVTSAKPSWFVDGAGGDLHLVSAAVAAIDRAQHHPDVTTDYDQESRSAGPAPDIGADEVTPEAGAAGPAADPTPLAPS